MVLETLKEDYKTTLGFIDKCDQHMFKVKSWALVTTSAVIAFAIARDEDLVVLVNLVLIPAFLYLELVYKTFQDTAIDHSNEVEGRIDRYLSGEETGLPNYKFGFGRKLHYPSISRVWAVLTNPNRRHIVLFYGFIAVASIGAFFVGRYIS